MKFFYGNLAEKSPTKKHYQAKDYWANVNKPGTAQVGAPLNWEHQKLDLKNFKKHCSEKSHRAQKELQASQTPFASRKHFIEGTLWSIESFIEKVAQCPKKRDWEKSVVPHDQNIIEEVTLKTRKKLFSNEFSIS